MEAPTRGIKSWPLKLRVRSQIMRETFEKMLKNNCTNLRWKNFKTSMS